MNCFQIVSLIYWTQLEEINKHNAVSCELLSDCIFDLLNTAIRVNVALAESLWIAFRLYLWFIEHSGFSRLIYWATVVNCFQIVSLIYWTQHYEKTRWSAGSCELLSDCIFDLLNTAFGVERIYTSTLWIAFRLYLWFIEHSKPIRVAINEEVVNCFQIVSLIYWTQQLAQGSISLPCCELLSDCIFDLLNTAGAMRLRQPTGLWIAFRLYLWFIEHSSTVRLKVVNRVVNCFQIVSLIYWTQQGLFKLCGCLCCELLSDCIFDLLNTAYQPG